MISGLLDEAEQAAVVGDWPKVLARAQAALILDPQDEDAQAFVVAAGNRESAERSTPTAAPAATLETVDQPRSAPSGAADPEWYAVPPTKPAEPFNEVIAKLRRDVRRPSEWISLALFVFGAVAWWQGAFDVFVMRQGLGFLSSHDCYNNLLGNVWCDGPWSTNPVPKNAIRTPDGFQLP